MPQTKTHDLAELLAAPSQRSRDNRTPHMAEDGVSHEDVAFLKKVIDASMADAAAGRVRVPTDAFFESRRAILRDAIKKADTQNQ